MELVCVGNLPLNTCWCLSSLLGRKDPEGAMVGRAGAVVQGYLGLPVHSMHSSASQPHPPHLRQAQQAGLILESLSGLCVLSLLSFNILLLSEHSA